MDKEAVIHFVAGAAGGTAGTACTCPLEVVKVRLQSSLFTGADHGKPSTSAHGDRAGLAKAHAESRVQSWQVRRPSVYAPIFNKAFEHGAVRGQRLRLAAGLVPNAAVYQCNVACCSTQSAAAAPPLRLHRLLFYHFRDIIRLEGATGLFRGLVPNIIGVAPSKAVYFYTYSSCKRALNDLFVPNTPIVHMCSAAVGGFVAASFINPVWLVKTRLQLDRNTGTDRLTVGRCIKQVFATDGLKGFYRGVTASYAGIAETIVQFVLYEYFRSVVLDKLHQHYGRDAPWPDVNGDGNGDGMDSGTDIGNVDSQPPVPVDNAKSAAGSAKALVFMLCGGSSKLIATTVAYPHEVARTRLREPGRKYTGLLQCLRLVAKEEGLCALYRGLFVHLLRTVPNTAITMATYEFVLHVMMRQ